MEHTVALFTYLPLAADGFAFMHRLNQAVRVFEQLVGRKAHLSDRRMNYPGLVDTEFHFASFNFLDGRLHIGRHGSRFRIRHQATGTQYLAKTSDRTHHVGCGDHGVVSGPIFGLDPGDHFFTAGKIRSSLLRFAKLYRLKQ